MRKIWISLLLCLMSLSLVFTGMAENSGYVDDIIDNGYDPTAVFDGYVDDIVDNGYDPTAYDNDYVDNIVNNGYDPTVYDNSVYVDNIVNNGYDPTAYDNDYVDNIVNNGYDPTAYDSWYVDNIVNNGYDPTAYVSPDVTYSTSIVDPVINVYMYVRTSGGHLNVRAWPDTNATIVGRLQYGEQVLVTGYAENRTWAKILYNGSTEYVLARYLSASWPGPTPTATPVPYYPTSQPVVTPYNPTPVTVPTINDLNTQFNSMVEQTTAITVSAHPARVGGFVTLYWAPDTNASVIRYCYEGETLTVLAYNNAWIQVKDNTTGKTGFVMRSFAY